jgi:DNA-directed RNA polymerase subunit beta
LEAKHKEIRYGRRLRRSYARIDEIMDLPHLIEIQKNSYEWFKEKGLNELLTDVSPIYNSSGSAHLEFCGYTFGEKKYSVEEAKERDANYAAPLKARVRLVMKETGEVKEQEVFMGEFPLMTDTGTFIINGTERVIVSQLVRSPSVYFNPKTDKNNKTTFLAQIIPGRGAWLELETDSRDVIYARIDRARKVPVTVLLRALGFASNEEIVELLGNSQVLRNTLEKDSLSSVREAQFEIYEKIRPGEPPTEESARSLLVSRFFDSKRYDLASVGRYKINKKLHFKNRLLGQTLSRDLYTERQVDLETGEIISEPQLLAKQGQLIDRKLLDYLIENERLIATESYDIESSKLESSSMKVHAIYIYAPVTDGDTDQTQQSEIKVITNGIIDPNVKCLMTADIIGTISYFINLMYSVGTTDDIDHLGNRRLRTVGELLQNQFRVGLTRMERNVKERMSVSETGALTPQSLINIRPLIAAIKEFFGSSQLSQFMDQHNPLAELTHKRRLSALGPGGLTRERAGFEVRDVHHSHYGRMCPIETPEGPNIGLINSLSSFAKINEYGFIETAYRKVGSDGYLTDQVDYMTADEEDNYVIAQANAQLDETGRFVDEYVVVRYRGNIETQPRERVNYMDVSPKQVVSIATALIPFLENDDSNRALMGSNMQRQAVPLLIPESPFIGTGVEHRAAKDSGVCIVADVDGVIDRVTADEIVVRSNENDLVKYKLSKFVRSNQGTCINQRPICSKGDTVQRGDILADGPSTELGELALGRNVVVAFMTWEGYNYEDAILLSEKLVKEDVYTSIHIEKYESEARETKLGPEEITRDIPNVGEDALRNLDERGIIRIGAEIKSGDILVGKVTPKGVTESTPEEKLLYAIFGEKVREVRDTSLRVPHGVDGIVVDVKVFTRENGDELSPGVHQLVRVYIAQKRKISEGDKMAGRHGNKGVVARILPEEDMPFLPDGTPVQVVLNPLGVPSRMNIGQVLEVHLGMAAKLLGFHVATPVFDGARENEVFDALKEAGLQADGKTVLFDGRTGERFERDVTVGVMYMIKLAHMVDDKIHARSTGPYSLVTQQPLGGKAQFGGQRFGEMEVWALEAYGAAYTLQEILTVKSDDVVGRVKTYEAIVKGENVPRPGVPESFKVLIKELQSLALDVKILNANEEEIEMKEIDEEDDRHPRATDADIPDPSEAPHEPVDA